jgi:hypothetical protein
MFSDYDHNQLSLQDCCNDLLQQHHTSLSKVALHKRFNQRSLDFLKAVLAEQMISKLEIETGNQWQPFSRVLIADSCKFSLPEQYKEDFPPMGGCRGGKSLMNIQYSFDIKHGQWENLEFTKARQNDQSHSKKTLDAIRKGDLYIRDLGFVIHDYLAKVVKEEAFFLNRLHPSCKPVETSSCKVIDWAALYKRMADNKEETFETIVTIGSGERAFSCRLIAVPVPPNVWSERIRKGQKQSQGHGYSLSDEYKNRSKFSIFISNVDQKILKAADVIQLYRLRWQIELIFKSWKSLFSIHKVKAVKKERLECQLIGKILLIIVNWRIYRCIDTIIQKSSSEYSCSMWKLLKHTRKYSTTVRAMVSGSIAVTDWLKTFIYPSIKFLLVEPKKGKKPAFLIVIQAFSA